LTVASWFLEPNSVHREGVLVISTDLIIVPSMLFSLAMVCHQHTRLAKSCLTSLMLLSPFATSLALLGLDRRCRCDEVLVLVSVVKRRKLAPQCEAESGTSHHRFGSPYALTHGFRNETCLEEQPSNRALYATSNMTDLIQKTM